MIDEALRKKFYAARRICRERWQAVPCPNLEEIEEGGQRAKQQITWSRWFELRFGQPLEAFIAEANERGYREAVRAYEFERFGQSAVRPKRAAA